MSSYPPISGPDPDADATLAALLDSLYARHNEAICCTLVYGSCLRSGDIYDGLLDLYLICDDYRAAYGTGLLALSNWMLPPNVFYAQQQGAQQTLRAKVTVISLRDFERGCSRAWFESYLWGRFAQPTLILNARDTEVRARIESALLSAAATLLHNALPLLPDNGQVSTLWEQALGLSYATELRTERAGRAAELAGAAQAFYIEVTQQQWQHIGHGFTVSDGGEQYTSHPTSLSKFRAKLSWGLRRVQGKLLSVMRLVKALFTFEGGLDYIAWKLTRHSGQEITVPDKVRKAPLIYLWGFFWGLYRQGIFK